jgi:Methylamine utilisation protein MauE
VSGAVLLDPGLGYVIVIGFALLFAHAALGKWRAVAEFGAVFASYRLFPVSLSAALGVLVPAAESAVALLILPAATRPWAAGVGSALLLGYAAAIAINLRRGRYDLDCGCAGPLDRRPIAAWMVWRNVALAAVLAATVLPWSARPLGWIDAISVGGGLIALALLYAALDRLLGQVMPRTAVLRGLR